MFQITLPLVALTITRHPRAFAAVAGCERLGVRDSPAATRGGEFDRLCGQY